MIVFCRHGERPDQIDNQEEKARIELPFDVHLTKRGELQTQRAGQKIKEIIGDKEVICIVSPFLRTIMSAFFITENMKIFNNTFYLQDHISEVLLNVDFKENPLPKIHFNVSGQSKSRGIKFEKNYIDHPDLILPVFPEDMEQCEKRIAIFHARLAEKMAKEQDPEKQVVLIISHQGPIRTYRFFLNGNHDESNMPFLQYCGIVTCKFNDIKKSTTNYQMIENGDNSYLKDLL